MKLLLMLVSLLSLLQHKVVVCESELQNLEMDDDDVDDRLQDEDAELRVPEVGCRTSFDDIGGRCIMVDPTTEGTWNEMKLYCHHQGGKLLKLDSADLMYLLVKYIEDSGLPKHSYWIGASDLEEEDHFVWLDGTPVRRGTPYWCVYTDPTTIEPTGGTAQNCVVLNGSLFYYFNDIGCDNSYHVICEQVD